MIPAKHMTIIATSLPNSGKGKTLSLSGSGAAKNARTSSMVMAFFSGTSELGIFTFSQGFVVIRIIPLS
ncbi:Uncharacterised protein [Segatella copri]|nr:Uncharacterised protein [Segatella copri]